MQLTYTKASDACVADQSPNPSRTTSTRSYSQLFGWQKTDAVQSPMGTYQMYGKGGRTFGGMATKPKELPDQPRWLYYVKVEDLDAALARVKIGGGKVMQILATSFGERPGPRLPPTRRLSSSDPPR